MSSHPKDEGKEGRRPRRERRSRWNLIAGALVVALGCPGLFGCGRSNRPDVILVTLDTTRVDHISAYGYARQVSPEIDRFARDAVLYRHAWSSASWTLPAHASMFTGRYPTSHGAHFSGLEKADVTLADALQQPGMKQFKANRLGEEQVTLAELLRDSGYETAAFVGGPWLCPPFGLLQGYALKDADVSSVAGRRADELTDHAIAWINGIPRERPIHVLINYFDPHGPYDPPPGYDDLPLAKEPLLIDRKDVNGGAPLPPEQRAVYIDRYDGEIRFMDHHFGRLIEALRETGRYEGAMIVVAADHGEAFGEHGFMGHGGWLYEEILHVPLIVRFPGGRGAGTEVSKPVSLVDLLPLISSEARFALPKGVEGIPIGRRDLVLAESYRFDYAVKRWGARFDRDLVAGIRWPWKLILPTPGTPEFYRLDEDPGELHNRIGEAPGADLRAELETTRAKLKPPERLSPPEDVSPEIQERLRSLEYVQ
jgi:arylsulfatase A-like enzyme